MPSIITRGAMSAQGFGFGGSDASNIVYNGLNISMVSSSYDYKGFSSIFADPAGNVYVSGYLWDITTPTYYAFIAKFSSTGVFQWGWYYPTSAYFRGGSCYYNGNVYWFIDTFLMAYFPTTISGGNQTVSARTFSGSLPYNYMRVDSSGNFYMADSTSFIKYDSTLSTPVFYKGVSAGSGYGFSGVPSISESCIFSATVYDNSTLKTAGAISIDSSGGVLNNYVWLNSSGANMYNSTRYASASGNTYTLIGENYSNLYLIAQNSSGTELWSKTYARSSIFGGGLSLVGDSSALYVSPANTGNTEVFRVSISDGSLLWDKVYSNLVNYSVPVSSICSGNPAFAGGFSSADTSAVVMPRTTGGKNGTYGPTVISNAAAMTVTSGTGLSRSAGPSTVFSATGATGAASSIFIYSAGFSSVISLTATPIPVS